LTYLRFHLLFNLPLLLVLGVVAAPSWSWGDTGWLGVTLVVVMLFTSPWDNWAVARGVWDFPQDRVLFRIRHLPVEEYAFFIIQTVQAALLADCLSTHLPGIKAQPNWAAAGGVCVVGVILGWLGRKFWRGRTTYLWHVLVWMVPVAAVQWCAGGFLVGYPAAVLWTVLGLGTVLSLFDVIAIRAGVWFFDESQTLSVKLFGILPVEEALFFYMTTLLAAQSHLLLSAP